MRVKDLLITLAVVAVWGFNFVVIRIMFGHMPPVLIVAMRYVLVALPLLPFVKRPSIRMRWVALYGLMLGTVHQGLLFIGMKAGMNAGLSSLVLQTQAFFTLILAVLFLRERPKLAQMIGLLFAAAGLYLIATATEQAGNLAAFGLVLLSAATWAVATLISRHGILQAKGKVDPLSFMVWASLFPPIPTLILSAILEGPASWAQAWAHLDWGSVAGIAFITYGSTLFGFVMWNRLIARYGAAYTAQFGLLVPIFGMTSGWLVLGESLTPVKLLAAGLVILGLAISVMGERVWQRMQLGMGRGFTG